MSIRSVEIICRPCPKCANLEPIIRQIVKNIEMFHRVKISFDYKHTVDFKEISKYSLNVSQMPVILINGNVEFAGKMDVLLLKKKFDSIHCAG